MDLNLLLEKLNNTDKSFEELSYMLFTYFEPFTYGPTYDERENEKYHQAKKIYGDIRRNIDEMINIAKEAITQENNQNCTFKMDLKLFLDKNYKTRNYFMEFSRIILVALASFTQYPNYDEEKREEYYKAKRIFDNFRKELDSAYKIVNEIKTQEDILQRNKSQENQPRTFVNSFGEATQRYISTSTYERQQNRLSKEIMSRLK